MDKTIKPSTGKTTVLAVALLLLIAAFAVIYYFNRPAVHPGEKNITVAVITRENTAGQIFTLKTDKAYLGEVLLAENIAQGDNSKYGLYIRTVAGITADESKKEWWCISKDGVDVMTGADVTPIADGDHFELTLKTW